MEGQRHAFSIARSELGAISGGCDLAHSAYPSGGERCLGSGWDRGLADRLDEETRCLGFYVKDVGLFFFPSEDGLTVRFMARRFTAEEHGYESRFLYRRAKPEPLRRLVEEALLRLLGPRRANAVNQ